MTEPTTVQAKVVSLQLLTADVYSLVLELAQTIDFNAGQYLMLDNQKPDAKDKDERPFSIACAPQQNIIELHLTYHESNAWIVSLLDTIKQSGVLNVTMPLGECIVRNGSRSITLIAAGTGLAPMKAKIESLLQKNDTRDCLLVWGARNEDDFYFLKEMKSLESERVTVITVSENASGDWKGETGTINDYLSTLSAVQLNSDFYIAGSKNMVFGVKDHLVGLGVDEQFIYSDMIDLARLGYI